MLAYAHENDVEPFLEPAAHLLAALLNDVGAWQPDGSGAQGRVGRQVDWHLACATLFVVKISLPPTRFFVPSGPSESQKAVGALPLLLELAGGAESEVAVAAAHGALKLLHLHPGDTAGVLGSRECASLMVPLLDPAAAAAQQVSIGGPGWNADVAPLMLLVLAGAAEARPALLRDHGDVLRPAVSACLEAIGDPGLRRRWAPLLRPS